MTIEEILKLRQEAGGLNKLMHMHVVTLDKDGGATVELDLTPELLNPLGMAHGGTIFALCDIAAGSAAASQGTVAVTLDSMTSASMVMMILKILSARGETPPVVTLSLIG